MSSSPWCCQQLCSFFGRPENEPVEGIELTASATERRIDPADGRAYTFPEITAHYASQSYSPDEILAYWNNDCQKASAPSKGKGKGKGVNISNGTEVKASVPSNISSVTEVKASVPSNISNATEVKASVPRDTVDANLQSSAPLVAKKASSAPQAPPAGDKGKGKGKKGNTVAAVNMPTVSDGDQVDLFYRPVAQSGNMSTGTDCDQIDDSEDLETQVRRWIEIVTGEKCLGKSMHEWLKDGIVICKLANKVSPGSIKKINTQAMPFKQMENITAFMNHVRSMGVPEAQLFSTVDLYEDKNMESVINCIYFYGGVIQSSYPAFKGPKLGKAIKAEIKDVKRDVGLLTDQSSGYQTSLDVQKPGTNFRLGVG